MALVESSKFIDNPKLCVSRQISACSICRGKKIKCDGLVPVCSPCQKSHRGSECTNGSDKFAKGKERSYVTALESRLDKLEKEIARARSLKPADEASTAAADPQIKTVWTAKGQRKEESHVNELVSDFGFLSVNATSRDFDGLAQDVFAQLILAPSTAVKLAPSDLDVLPSRQIVTSLVQHYIDHDLAFYPFISEAKIFGTIEALYEGYAAPSDEWTVFLILAIALVSLSTSAEDGSYAEAVRYVGAVQKHAKMVLLPGSVQSIQMMLLLVVYSIRDPHHFDSWYLVGAAARMMVDLGLHQDPPKSIKMTDAQLNLRRRIYYSVYALDRATATVHQRAFSFSDDSTNVAMPSLVSASVHQDTVRNAHPATELIQLRRAASPAYMALFQSGYDVLRNLWPTLTSADQALHEWEHSLRDTDLPTATKSIFHAEMLYIKIVLLSPSRLKRPLEDYGQRLIFDHAVQYSQTISSLVEDHVNASLCTSYDLLRTIFVARTTVEVVTRCEDICFRSAPPPIPVSLITAQVPPLSGYSGRERLALAIRAFSLLDKVIGTLGRRYRVPKSWTHFRTRFDGVHANLRSRIAA